MCSRSPIRIAWLALALAVVPAVSGQSILLALYKDKLEVVRGASGSRPLVEVKGKRVTASGDRFALRPVDNFLPAFISVRYVNVRTSALQVVGTGGTINHQFELRAQFSSDLALPNVYLVLELEFENGTKSLFLHEIGDLKPRVPRQLSLTVPMSFDLGSGHYRLHLFTEGMEVLHTEIPFAAREAALDRLVNRHNAGRVDAAPELFIGTPPEYPRAMEKKRLKGHVRIRTRILPNGAVVDPAVIETTDPAFGESALAAVRLWRFLPRMKQGHAVAATVDLPVEFSPTDAKADG